jgi:hypothetical protein
MRATLEQYRDPINRGEINPQLRYDGRRSGTLLDPADPQVPLHVLSFAVRSMSHGTWWLHCRDRISAPPTMRDRCHSINPLNF